MAEEGVVAALAEELVASRASGEGVVAGAAEQVCSRQRTVRLAQADRVAAGLTEDPDQARVRNRRVASDYRDRAIVHQDPARRVAADDDRVVGGVAGDAQHTRAERRCRRRARGRARRHDRSGTDHDTPKQPARRTAPIAVTCFLHRLGVAHDDPFKSGRCP